MLKLDPAFVATLPPHLRAAFENAATLTATLETLAPATLTTTLEPLTVAVEGETRGEPAIALDDRAGALLVTRSDGTTSVETKATRAIRNATARTRLPGTKRGKGKGKHGAIVAVAPLAPVAPSLVEESPALDPASLPELETHAGEPLPVDLAFYSLAPSLDD